MIEFFKNQILAITMLSEPAANAAAETVATVLLLLLSYISYTPANYILTAVGRRIASKTASVLDDIMVEKGVFSALAHLVPAMILRFSTPVLFAPFPHLRIAVRALVSVYFIIIALMVADAVINAATEAYGKQTAARRLPIKGFAQALKLLIFILGIVLILSVTFGKSPIFFLSGIGALTAILLLVFRDAILGLVAGIQLSVNDMVQTGDWIEMPKHDADGEVIDVSLTTVKVQNWDKTITSIPSYELVSSSFKNWRGMTDAGGRRIKRSLFIDVQTIRFADHAMLEKFLGINLLKTYLAEKLAEIEKENDKAEMGDLINSRRLTNIGTFRAYCLEYLRSNPNIHQGMTVMVRHLAPTSEGLPLEIYVFTRDTRWANYENIQADIFDHLLGILPEFGLSAFQKPGSADIRSLSGGLKK